MSDRKQDQDNDVKKDGGAEAADKRPAAGPHARRDLTNYDATPGTGSLSGPDDEEGVSS